MSPKPKGGLSILIGAGHKEPDAEAGEGASEQEGEMRDLAQAFIDAVSDKDPEAAASAFKAMHEECMKDE